ncbi:MAG: MBL fold metallo-hydrolase, partial [Dehalococcoidia bacterium]
MVANRIVPLEVDEVRVTTVVDNSIDLLLVSDAVAQRYPTSSKWLPIVSALPNPIGRDHPVAEYGFSALINVSRGDSSSTVLFDTGVSQRGLLHNIDALDIDLKDIQALILS